MANTPMQLFGMQSMGIPPMDGMEDDAKGFKQIKGSAAIRN
jgi:hypothetical protein